MSVPTDSASELLASPPYALHKRALTNHEVQIKKSVISFRASATSREERDLTSSQR
jgi:hypothetical protein